MNEIEKNVEKMDEEDKKLNPCQQRALALLTSGLGMTYEQIAKEAGVTRQQLWKWRTQKQFAYFQKRLDEINQVRWEATIDAARSAALDLCKDRNPQIVKYVLESGAGYVANKKLDVNADVSTDINITIGEE